MSIFSIRVNCTTCTKLCTYLNCTDHKKIIILKTNEFFYFARLFNNIPVIHPKYKIMFSFGEICMVNLIENP